MNRSYESNAQQLPSLPRRWHAKLGGFTLFAAIAACAVALAHPGPATIIVAVLVLTIHVFYFDITREAVYATPSTRQWTRLGRLADTLGALAIGTFLAIPSWVSGVGAIFGIILIVARVQLGRIYH